MVVRNALYISHAFKSHIISPRLSCVAQPYPNQPLSTSTHRIDALEKKLKDVDVVRVKHMQTAVEADADALRRRLEEIEGDQGRRAVAEANEEALRARLERRDADRHRHAAAEANEDALRRRLDRMEVERSVQPVAEANADALRQKLEAAEASRAQHMQTTVEATAQVGCFKDPHNTGILTHGTGQIITLLAG